VDAQQATDILGVNRRRNGDLREMLRALTLYPWLNTAEDEKRKINPKKTTPILRARSCYGPANGRARRLNLFLQHRNRASTGEVVALRS
jgi:hypothetical protein